MNCVEIIKKYLKENGYDGLYLPNGGCNCEPSNLATICEGKCAKCKPGYKVMIPPGHPGFIYESYICATKDTKPWEDW